MRKKDSCILCDFATIVERVSSRKKLSEKGKCNPHKESCKPGSSTDLVPNSNNSNGNDIDENIRGVDNTNVEETVNTLNYFHEEPITGRKIKHESECRLCRVANEVRKISKASFTTKSDIFSYNSKTLVKSSSVFNIEKEEEKSLFTYSIEKLYKSLEKIHKNYLDTSKRLSILEKEKRNPVTFKNDEKVSNERDKSTSDANLSELINSDIVIENDKLDEKDFQSNECHIKVENDIETSGNLRDGSEGEFNSDHSLDSGKCLFINSNNELREHDSENKNNLNSSEQDTEKISFLKVSSSDTDKTSENGEITQPSKSSSFESFPSNIANEVQVEALCDWISEHEVSPSSDECDNVTKMLHDRVSQLEVDVSRMTKALKSQFNDPMDSGNGYIWKTNFQKYLLAPTKGELVGRPAWDFLSGLMHLEWECLTELSYLRRKKQAIDHLAGMAFTWGPMIHR